MKSAFSQMRILLLIVISLPLSAFLFSDFIHSRPSPNNELVHGQVIRREMGLVGWLRIERPLLTIKIDNSDVIVQGSLSLNGINDMPDTVTFYYSGNPSREVYLQEEYNPIWGSIFFVVIFIFSLWYFMKRE